MRTVCIVILIFMLQSCHSQVDQSNAGWKNDIDFLKKELPAKHKDFFTIRTREEFEKELNEIISRLENLDDEEIIISLQKVLASFGDSHTHIEFSSLVNPQSSLPLTLYWFKSGLYILETSERNKPLLGNRISAINKYPVDQICDSLKTFFTVDNKAIVKLYMPALIKNRNLLKYFGFSDDDTYEVEIVSTNGTKNTYGVDLIPINDRNKIKVQTGSAAYCWRNRREFFTQEYFERDSIYYIQYNKCTGREVMKRAGFKERAAKCPSFQDFKETVFSTIKAKPVNKFIFDMRFNGGGSSLQGTTFVKQLQEFKKVNEKGKLYVVIGRNTFSSAVLNTMDFKKMTEAIIVGEETSGKPNHFGEIRSFALPHSKIPIIYSTKYFKRSNEDINTIIPDIKIETTFEDYTSGIDPVYEWIKNN